MPGFRFRFCRIRHSARAGTALIAATLLAATPAFAETPAIADRDRQTMRSPDGMVSSASALATRIGAETLARGGNAIDAAVATKFAISVALPSMAGIGGRTQMLIHTADGEWVGIDGGTEVPMDFDRDGGSPGYRTAGIPGTVSALYRAQRKYGKLDFAEVVMPAVRLAEEGFAMPADEAGRHAEVAARLARYPGTREVYLKPDGSPYAPGEHFRNLDLANTLRLIAEGGEDAFYHGPIAELIAKDMAERGGFLTRENLAGYEAREHPVYRGTYRGHNVYGTYRPATGVMITHILQMMEQFELPEIAGSPEWVSVLAQAMRIGRESRREDADLLVSYDFAVEQARRIGFPRPSETGADTDDEDGADANTTHLSTADREGNFVSMTGSLGPSMGSHVVSPGLGFLYAQTMHYSGDTPGTRPTTNMTPLILTDAEDRPIYLTGGAGAARIVSAVVLSLSRSFDQRLPLDEAVAAPRFHPLSNNRLVFEKRDEAAWDPAFKAKAEELGYTISTNDSATYFGRVHAIQYDRENGEFIGVADPRRAGTASGPPSRP